MPNTPPGSIGANVRSQTPSGGLMSGISVGGPGIYQYTPPKKHLVYGLMQQYTDPNTSQFVRQASDRGAEFANARGMGSGAYAAGAAAREAIGAALPMAQQDSETLTRVGLANATSAQQYNDLLTQLEAARSEGGSQNVYGGPSQEEMDHELQLQRERLAFEGEQNAFGRQQQNSMGMFDLYGSLFGNQMDYANQRQLGYDQFGFNRALAGDQFNFGRTMAGDNFMYDTARNQQQADLGLRSDYFNYLGNTSQSRNNFYQNVILGGMQNPEWMANPEAFFGFAQYATGMVPGAGSSFFNSLFGRGG